MKLIVDKKQSRVIIEGEVNTDDVESLLKDTLEFVVDAAKQQTQFSIDAHNAQIVDFAFYIWLLSLGKYVINKGGERIILLLDNQPLDNSMAEALTFYYKNGSLV